MSAAEKPPAERPPWFDDVRTPPSEVPPAATRPAPLLFDDKNQSITTPASWNQRREQLTAQWRTFLGTIAAPRAIGPVTILEEDRRDGAIRRLIRYEAEPDLPVEGY